ncbi:MAG: GAF domain-containing sensor histidine kinase [Acidimicrobiia bacterium]
MPKSPFEDWAVQALSAEAEERVEAAAFALRLIAALSVFGTLVATRDLDSGLKLAALAIFSTTVIIRLLPFSRKLPPRPYAEGLLAVEVGAYLAAMLATGGWVSVYGITMLSPIFVATVAYGPARAFVPTLVLGIPLTALAIVENDTSTATVPAIQTAFLFLAGIGLGALARSLLRSSRASDQETFLELERLRRAGTLVRELHTLVLRTPESFDLEESATNLLKSIRATVTFDAIALFVYDLQQQTYRVAAHEGCRDLGPIASGHLPAPLQMAASAEHSVAISCNTFGAILDEGSLYGLYAPVKSGAEAFGVVALERATTAFLSTDAEIVDELVLPFAAALDNSRWFDRVSGVISESERVRIARDLHDHVAQGLAHLKLQFELLPKTPEGIADEIPQLHATVTDLLGDVRLTLRDLRQAQDDEVELATLVENELRRMRLRGINARLITTGEVQLDSAQRRETWMITREALRNAATHGEPSQVVVMISQEGGTVRVRVDDDGKGFDPLAVSGERFGLTGMKERANAIGARLTLSSNPRQGTCVLLEFAS